MNTIQATTNDICNSACVANLDYHGMWSLCQYDALFRISYVSSGITGFRYLKRDADRVKAIAAQYAKMYLEQTTYGDKNKRGRFYWMGLGAFAAKQVYCGIYALDDFVNIYSQGTSTWLENKLDKKKISSQKLNEYLNKMPKSHELPSSTDMKYTKEKMLKGNLWLYLDIYTAHEFYCRYPKSFMNAVRVRDSREYIDHKDGKVKTMINNVPDATDALKELGYFGYNGNLSYLIQGFTHIKNYETATLNQKRGLQYASLMAIAEHEQRVVLQNCFYAPNGKIDKTLKSTFDKQKTLEKKYPHLFKEKIYHFVTDIQGRQATLTNTCQFSKAENRAPLTSVPQKDRHLFVEDMKDNENLYEIGQKNSAGEYISGRMAFITRIADDYHAAMGKHPSVVEGFLQQLAKENIVRGV